MRTEIDFKSWLAANRDHPNPDVRFTWMWFINVIGGSRARSIEGMRRWAVRHGNTVLHAFDAAVSEWRLPADPKVISLAEYRASIRLAQSRTESAA